jgi:hypothetical protein
MTNAEQLKQIKAYSDELLNDPVRLKAFMRKVMGPPRRTLEGEEREQVLTMLALIGPTVTTNNQRSWSEDYVQSNRHWCVTYFPGEEAIVEEIERETD